MMKNIMKNPFLPLVVFFGFWYMYTKAVEKEKREAKKE
jgi:hypothetical protein